MFNLKSYVWQHSRELPPGYGKAGSYPPGSYAASSYSHSNG